MLGTTDYCYFLDFELFRIWTLRLKNLGLGLDFGFKAMDLHRIRILKC